MDEEDKLVTAYHEAGHALVAEIMPDTEQLHKVTIIPRGAALGSTMVLPEKDKYHYRKKELLASIRVLYAGRIAEDMFCDDISGGAQNDIDRASEIARLMVCHLGMSDKIGPVSYGEKQGHVFLGEELMRAKNHSEEMSEQIDKEVKHILDTCYRETEELIEQHKDEVEIIAKALMLYETITGKEVEAITQGKRLEEIDFEYAPDPTTETPSKAPAQPPKGEKNEEPGLDPGDLPAAGEPAY
jgi:cell division protease FtsH